MFYKNFNVNYEHATHRLKFQKSQCQFDRLTKLKYFPTYLSIGDKVKVCVRDLLNDADEPDKRKAKAKLRAWKLYWAILAKHLYGQRFQKCNFRRFFEKHKGVGRCSQNIAQKPPKQKTWLYFSTHFFPG